MSPTKPQRPTIAPEVIVEQVSANANWKTQYASSGTPVVRYVSGSPWRKNPCVPMNGVPSMNMNAKPQAQKVMPQMQVSTIPSTRILIDSRERANPASSMTNPTCIQKTRNAATSTQTVFSALISGVGPSAAYTGGAIKILMAASTIARPITLPPNSAATFQRINGSERLFFTRVHTARNSMVFLS